MRVTLETRTLKGFKTIRELDGKTFRPGPINVLIGPNGVGKSNFISFFRFLSRMLKGDIQEHIASLGGANALLHKGAGTTREISAQLLFHTETGENNYQFWLSHAAADTLIFTNERFNFLSFPFSGRARWWAELGAGHREAQIIRSADTGDEDARVMLSLMRQWVVYQFHDTSSTARMRQKWNENDNRLLKEDGANLAPFLLRLREEKPSYYHRIVENLRLILPFFADFDLAADRFGSVILQWRERDNDVMFSAPQAADGMLRCIALVTLLAQPEDNLPGVLILDEPELGLHPYAISVVAGLLKSISKRVQIFVATQSTALLDHFNPEDIVVLDRKGGETIFSQFDSKRLSNWLEEYSLSELWEKNVLGGRP